LDEKRGKENMPKNPPFIPHQLLTKDDITRSSTTDWRRTKSMSLDLLPIRSRRKTADSKIVEPSADNISRGNAVLLRKIILITFQFLSVCFPNSSTP
jgi:hypothetical protein